MNVLTKERVARAALAGPDLAGPDLADVGRWPDTGAAPVGVGFAPRESLSPLQRRLAELRRPGVDRSSGTGGADPNR